MPKDEHIMTTGSKISIALTALIIAAGYTAYRDVSKDIPSRDTVEANKARIQSTIDWDKEQFLIIDQSRKETESRLQAQLDKLHSDLLVFQGQQLHNNEVIGTKLDYILERLPRRAMLERPFPALVRYAL